MENIAYTICAKNYIGLAQVLEHSIRKFNKDIEFYILVADEVDDDLLVSLPDNVLISKDILKDQILESEWNELSFKYNLTEFCTSIKPFCFKYLFDKKNASNVIYLDPDIYFFSNIDVIFSLLNEYQIILTPHITQISEKYEGDRPELGLLSSGVYNLGFLALAKSSETQKLLNWWGNRLRNFCFIDPIDGSFTDQRWIDFIPCFFENKDLLVSKNKGLNLAPWNFFERKILKKDGGFFVENRNKNDGVLLNVDKLVFVHFSGYNYNSILNGKIEQNNIPNLKNYLDIGMLSNIYRDALVEYKTDILKFLNKQYTYSYFDNGITISHINRRLFRAIIESGEVILNPFGTFSNSYYTKLKNAKLLSFNNKESDKVNKGNLVGVSAKIKKINFLMKYVFKILGVEKYTLLIRFFRPYSRLENQVFLLDKNKNTL